MVHLHSLFLALLSLSSSSFAATTAVHKSHFHISQLQKRAPQQPKQVIIQLFEWSFDSVAAECTNFIGPAGYGYVQVSPATEHIQGSQWWTDYQLVSYQLTSKRGNRAAFANMINTCHAAGVKVIHDTIINHAAGIDGGVGVAGSSFSHYNYPGIYSYDDFHHCGLAPGDDIADWTSRAQMQNCELSNLADLKTESSYVQDRLVAHLNDLLSLGVDGIRIDAAKHVPAQDIQSIMNRLTSRPYVTQEIVQGPGISSDEYLGIGDVQEFRYPSAIKNAFISGDIAVLGNLADRGWTPTAQANVFVVNHDTERSGGANSLSASSPSNTYVLAHIFSLAFPYGTPTILSSYEGFGDAGGPNGGYGTCSGSSGTNGWFCQHRWTPIAGMTQWRNTVGSAGIDGWVVGAAGGRQLAFSRGGAGHVAINNGDSAWTTTLPSSLPAGRYCDVINGAKTSGTACSGTTYTVANGAFTVTVPGRSAVALHIGAKLDASSTPTPTPGTVAVTFTNTVTVSSGQNVFVVGSIPALGNWNTGAAVALSSAGAEWRTTISIGPNTAFEYKFIRKNSDGSIMWESDPNRQANTPAGGAQTLGSSWR